MAELQTQGSEMRHKAQLALQLLGQHVENRDAMLLIGMKNGSEWP